MKRAAGIGIIVALFAGYFALHAAARGFWPTLLVFSIAFGVLALVILAGWLIFDE